MKRVEIKAIEYWSIEDIPAEFLKFVMGRSVTHFPLPTQFVWRLGMAAVTPDMGRLWHYIWNDGPVVVSDWGTRQALEYRCLVEVWEDMGADGNIEYCLIGMASIKPEDAHTYAENMARVDTWVDLVWPVETR